LNQQLSKLPQGTVFSFSPPAIPGVGTSGGFQFVLEDRSGKTFSSWQATSASFWRRPASVLNWYGQHDVSTERAAKFVEVDREKVLKQGVAINDVLSEHSGFHGRAVHQTTTTISGVRGRSM